MDGNNQRRTTSSYLADSPPKLYENEEKDAQEGVLSLYQLE